MNNTPVSPAAAPLLRRSQRVVSAAAEPSGAQIPASPPPRQAKWRACPRRIQSRGSRRLPSSASHQKKNNAPCFWGARRARGGDYNNPALSRIQLLEKRRFYFCANSPAWGVKRARSVICCDVKLVVDPAPARDVDWANLGDGPAGLIADLLLADDVADYVRFRAVCQPWRRCPPDPRAGGLDSRFLPRRWIMLDKAINAGPCCHRFLNISTGECIRMDLPELAQHRFLSLTPEGLILLLNESNLVAHLLNPLTRQLIHLPPISRLLTREQRRSRRLGHPFALDLRLEGVGIVADASMVVVRFNSPTVLAVAKPGTKSWTVVNKDRHINSTTMFAGRFYCINYNNNRVMMLDTSSADKPPQLLVSVKWSRTLINFSPMTHSLRLMDNDGELLLLHRTVRSNLHPYKCEVYRVDLNAGILIPIKSLNGRAMFMGNCRAISISPEAFPSVTRDILYLGNDCDEKRSVDGYNIADGSNEPRCNNRWANPCTLVECLSSCICSSGKQLA